VVSYIGIFIRSDQKWFHITLLVLISYAVFQIHGLYESQSEVDRQIKELKLGYKSQLAQTNLASLVSTASSKTTAETLQVPKDTQSRTSSQRKNGKKARSPPADLRASSKNQQHLLIVGDENVKATINNIRRHLQ